MGENFVEAAPKPLPSDPSHLICWNVHKATDERFTNEVQELLEAIPDRDAVILCLQEVRSSTYDRIKELGRERVSGHYAPSWRYPFSGRSTGVLTVGNRPLPAAGVERLHSPRREFYLTSPKVSLRTEVPLADGRRLQVVNCHALNFVSKAVYARQLDQVFEALEDPNQPAIVCGDLNVWSAARLEMLREKAEEVGLTEAETESPGKSPAPRWLRGLSFLNGFDPDIPLDRIFTRGVEVLECYCVETSLSSDHLPLVLRFAVDS